MSFGIYAYICSLCNHRVVKHTSKGAGPFYQCAFCPCLITRDSPVRGLRLREYEAWSRQNPEAAIVEEET